MATRRAKSRKSVRKRAPARRGARRKAARKKGARRKPARKKAARKRIARKTSGRKKAKRKAMPKKKASARRKPAAKGKAPKAARTAAPSAEAIARKIVRVTQDPSKLVLGELYAESIVSQEPGGGDPAVGFEGLRAKTEFWEGLQDSSKTKWKAKNVFAKKNQICIEWEAQVALRDGRSMTLEEVAIHELKGGKIVAERYYYDPSALAPPAAPPEPARPPEPERVTPIVQPIRSSAPLGSDPEEPEDIDDDPDDPSVDPLDL